MATTDNYITVSIWSLISTITRGRGGEGLKWNVENNVTLPDNEHDIAWINVANTSKINFTETRQNPTQ